MPGVQPATIGNELGERISLWLQHATKYADQGDWTYRGLLRDAEKLWNADRYDSSIKRALVHHLAGNLEEAMVWVENARQWPKEEQSWKVEILIKSNLGYFGEAAERLELWADYLRPDIMLMHVGLICGAFRYVANTFAGTSLAETPEGRQAKECAERCTMSLQRAGVTEKQVQQVLDVAGGVLRRHEIFFAGEKPLIRVLHDGVLYQLAVPANAADSASMTDEVLLEMVDRDIDLPGFSFSFIPS